MPKTQLPITGGFYISRSLPISAQECSNYYVHINDGGGLATESLFSTAGAIQLATSGSDLQVNRGAWTMNGIPYFVNGTTLYRLNEIISGTGAASYTLDSLGTIAGSGRVSMADNGTQLCILNRSGNGYIWVEDTTTFSAITDTDFDANGTPRHVIYIDGYFLFTTDSKKFIISALNDGLAYNALDFGSAEADPDDIVAPVVLNNQVHIFGSQTMEVFRNVGGSGFPFSRIEGASITIGCFARWSAINTSGLIAFIGGSENDEPSIYTFNGSGIDIISTDAIDGILGSLTEEQLDGVFSWTYTQEGDHFVGFTLPNQVFVYEFKSKKWHERKSFDIIDDVATEFRWRANSVIRAYGQIIIGDNIDGRVGAIDLDYYDEYGNNILGRIATIPFTNLGERLLVPMIEMTVESGVGNDVDEDPLISMDRSLDGHTWTPKRERKFGKKGKYNNRAIWRRNGRAARGEIFRFSTSAKVKKVLIKLEADIL